jgi:SAM-dependent methyltransferase
MNLSRYVPFHQRQPGSRLSRLMAAAGGRPAQAPEANLQLDTVLYAAHPSLTTPEPEEDEGLVTNMLYQRLPADFADRLLGELPKAASFLEPEVRTLTGLTPANPPPSIHSMVREEFYSGDLYHCDMIAGTLSAIGIDIRDGGQYLDFGASSGRVVRNMQAAFPQATWYGCDPQAEAVNWARENLDKRLRLFVSDLKPPLPAIDSNTLDGVFAISVWSHFSQPAARAWFDEMARCLKPGGWLMFTTHGPNTLRHYAQHALKLPDQLKELHTSLFRDGYVFEDVFGAAGDWSVPSTDWGNCYILPSWICLNLVGHGWSLAVYKVGRATLDQDLYVLVKT